MAVYSFTRRHLQSLVTQRKISNLRGQVSLAADKSDTIFRQYFPRLKSVQSDKKGYEYCYVLERVGRPMSTIAPHETYECDEILRGFLK